MLIPRSGGGVVGAIFGAVAVLLLVIGGILALTVGVPGDVVTYLAGIIVGGIGGLFALTAAIVVVTTHLTMSAEDKAHPRPWGDVLSGTWRPDSHVDVLSADRLRDVVLALETPDRPWRVRDGAPEGADLVAEWVHQSASLGPAGVALSRTVFTVTLRLDAERRVVRAFDETSSREWVDGKPWRGSSRSSGRGNLNVKSRYSVNDPEHGWRHVEYDTDTVKKPLRDAVTAAGWTWTYRRSR